MWNRNYSETRLPATPSTIIELLSHQNFADMQLGHDPNFKFTVGRAIYKGILQFITSVWEETSPEVADALVILTEEVCKFRNDMVLREDDALKFKNPEDAQPVFQMLLLMAEGYAARYRGAAAFDFQAVMEDFEENIAILRKNFYKEEYQK